MRKEKFSFVALGCGLASLALSTACANAQRDFDRFDEKTKAARYKPPVDAGPPPDAATPTAPFEGTFLAACAPQQLVNGDFSVALRMRADVTFTPTTDGAGTLKIKLQPLAVKEVDVAKVIGTPFEGSGPLGPSPAFDITFYDNANPGGAAAPIFPKESVALGLAVPMGVLKVKGYAKLDSPPRLCGELSGETASGVAKFYETIDPCVWIPATPGTPLDATKLTTEAEFSCP